MMKIQIPTFSELSNRFIAAYNHYQNGDYWLNSSRLFSFLPALIPLIVFLYYFTKYSPEYTDAMVKVSGIQKKMLLFHAVFADVTFIILDMPLNESESNGVYASFSAIADLMFVTASTYAFIGTRSVVPRWVLFIPILQTTYNLVNDYRWINAEQYGSQPKPVDAVL
eukprot:Pgem_evm1s18988